MEDKSVVTAEINTRMTYADGTVREMVLGRVEMTEDGDENVARMVTALRAMADECEAFGEELEAGE